MESVSSLTKRKKRKTRKCLNEIRKRSRQNYIAKDVASNQFTHKSNQKVETKMISTVNNNNCITSNRLTLAMFPKAVRSETITRPALAEIQNKNSLHDLSTATKLAVTEQGNSIVLQLDDSKSNTCEDSEKEVVESISSPLSFLSHGRENIGIEACMSPEPNQSMSSASTSLYANSTKPPGYHLYEQFMEDLSLHLVESAPSLAKDDVIMKTKSYLHRIYVNGCQSEYENNVRSCMNSSLNEILPTSAPIEENPIDYIKYAYSYQKDDSQKDSPSTSPINSQDELSSLPSGSTTQADSSIVDTDTPITLSIIHDTPEYNYYPRKLN